MPITTESCRRLNCLRNIRWHRISDVVFPGGYGTFDELFEALALVQTRTIAPLPIVLVGERYWRRVVDFDLLVEEGMIDPEDVELFWYAESAEEIWKGIRAWHADPRKPPQPEANISCFAP